MAARKETAGAKVANLKFEEALQRLETLVEKMEGGELGLDELINAFEEGQRLLQHCGQKLNEVEQRIELLTQGANGKLEAKPFTPADGPADRSP